jgi:hypothetical protein
MFQTEFAVYFVPVFASYINWELEVPILYAPNHRYTTLHSPVFLMQQGRPKITSGIVHVIRRVLNLQSCTYHPINNL